MLYIASPWLPNPDAFVMDTNHGKLSAYLDPPARPPAPELDEHRAAILRELGL